jgi:hypothetical protein
MARRGRRSSRGARSDSISAGPTTTTCVDRARARWTKKQPPITAVRDDIAQLLERSGGVLPAEEIAEALLVPRGSVATSVQPSAAARPRPGRSPSRPRDGGGSAAPTASPGGASVVGRLGGGRAPHRRARRRGARRLRRQPRHRRRPARRRPTLFPVPVDTRARTIARGRPRRPGSAPLPDFRLARLAACRLGERGGVEPARDLPARPLPPERGDCVLARAALLGAGTLSEDDVRNRVRTRLPPSEPNCRTRPAARPILLDQDVLGLELVRRRRQLRRASIQPPGFWIPPAAGDRRHARHAVRIGFGCTAPPHRHRGQRARRESNASMADEAHDRLARHAAATAATS